MATVVGLDEIRDEAQQQFGDLEIGLPNGSAVRLRHALRLPKKHRVRLAELAEQISTAAGQDGGGEDALLDALGEILVLVAETRTAGRALLAAIDGDVLTLMGLFRRYQEVCQLPEASRSTT